MSRRNWLIPTSAASWIGSRSLAPTGDSSAPTNDLSVCDHHEFERVKRKLEALAVNTDPIVVGPWISEVGFELLYWIPFLHWVVDEYKIDLSRLTIVSRGGVRGW